MAFSKLPSLVTQSDHVQGRVNTQKSACILVIVLLAALLLMSACLPDSDGQKLAGDGGQSLEIDNQFVIIWNGYNTDKITYVIVRNWPRSSSPDERLKDQRAKITGYEKPLIRLPDGKYEPVAKTPYLYFYDGDNLTSVPISMQESDFMKLNAKAMTSYSDLLKFFKSYEVK